MDTWVLVISVLASNPQVGFAAISNIPGYEKLEDCEQTGLMFLSGKNKLQKEPQTSLFYVPNPPVKYDFTCIPGPKK
jgi:hypothetical protein